MAIYVADPHNRQKLWKILMRLQSTLLYMEWTFGARILQEPSRMYAVLRDLSPELDAYGASLRRLAEQGLLPELDRATRDGDGAGETKVMERIRSVLEQEPSLVANGAASFLPTLLENICGVAPLYPPQNSDLKPDSVPHEYAPVSDVGRLNSLSWTLYQNGLLVLSGYATVPGYADNPPWEIHRRKIRFLSMRDGIFSIQDGAFMGYENLSGVVIPEGLRSVGANAFSLCTNLTEVDLPDSVQEIGASAFSDCASLRHFTLSRNITSLGFCVFRNCASLTEVAIPDHVISIGNKAFSGCGKLNFVSVPNVVRIHPRAFDQHTVVLHRTASGRAGSLTWVLDENGVLVLFGSGPLENYSPANRPPWWNHRDKIRSVFVQEGVSRIGEWAFHDCRNLAYLTMSNSVGGIGIQAFSSCETLFEAVITNDNISVEAEAFQDCPKFKMVRMSPKTAWDAPEWIARHEPKIIRGNQHPSGIVRTGEL